MCFFFTLIHVFFILLFCHEYFHTGWDFWNKVEFHFLTAPIMALNKRAVGNRRHVGVMMATIAGKTRIRFIF